MPKVRLEFVRKGFAAGRMDGLIRLMAKREIEEDLKIIKSGHEQYVESWETALSTPEFYIDFEYEGAHSFIASVKMEADSAEDATLSVWQLLDRDQGTEVRYMQISKDWQSKTWPGRFPSGPGAGHTTGLGAPQKGIESRHIADTVEAEVFPGGLDIYAIYEHALQVAFAHQNA